MNAQDRIMERLIEAGLPMLYTWADVEGLLRRKTRLVERYTRAVQAGHALTDSQRADLDAALELLSKFERLIEQMG